MAAVLLDPPGAGLAYGRRSPVARCTAAGAIAVVHLAVLAGILQIPPVRQSVVEAAPVFVQFMMAPAPRPEMARPETPRPLDKPVPRPIEKKQLLASKTPAPASEAATAPVPPPAAEAAPALPSAAVTEAPLAPVIPPSFVAAYLDNPAPAYPDASYRRGETGRVMLAVHVSDEGRADDVKVAHSSGFERLDKAALDVVKRWRFAPARQGDKPLAAWVQVPIAFELANPR